MRIALAILVLGSVLTAGAALSAAAAEPVRITWWHAMSGQLGEASSASHG
jgi:ABC-type glycerol-3-phosphate transport system substrate-binding protein